MHIRPRDPDQVKNERDTGKAVSRAKICLLILLTATAVVAPLVFYGYYPGDDVEFHTSLWFETVRQWQEGVPYARWAGQATFGYGNPAMVFYPPLSRILGGALLACLPSRTVLAIYGWLGLVLGGFSFFYLAREFLDDRSSLVGAFAYIINPYNLGVLYIRCAFSEFLAAALFPLFVLAVLRLGAKGKRSIALLALWVAVFWLTNIPGAIIANYLAALMVLVLALVRKSISLLGRFVVAEVLGTGLAAFYLLPARIERPLIDVGQIFAWNPLASFLLAGGWYKRTAWLDIMLNVGFVWVVLVGAAAWFYASKFRSERRDVLAGARCSSGGFHAHVHFGHPATVEIRSFSSLCPVPLALVVRPEPGCGLLYCGRADTNQEALLAGGGCVRMFFPDYPVLLHRAKAGAELGRTGSAPALRGADSRGGRLRSPSGGIRLRFSSTGVDRRSAF